MAQRVSSAWVRSSDGLTNASHDFLLHATVLTLSAPAASTLGQLSAKQDNLLGTKAKYNWHALV